ncbi:MAG: hypothetical protein ACTSQD_09920 [Promethearchaeota archaeon]
MKCVECESTERLRKVKDYGVLCYFCFDKKTDAMCAFQEDWLRTDIFPSIKEEVKNGIMDSDEFRVLDYMRESEFAEIEVAEAIEEMLEENALPEKVRKFLAAYKSLFSPDVEFEAEDE